MKIRIKLIDGVIGRELDRQTIETSDIGDRVNADEIIEALKAWAIGAGDTIKIEEVE